LIGDRKCEKFVRKRLLESIILLSTWRHKAHYIKLPENLKQK
jgi:hypothetical protein